MNYLTTMTNEELIAERERRRDMVRALQMTGAQPETLQAAALQLGIARAEMLRRGIEAAYLKSLEKVVTS